MKAGLVFLVLAAVLATLSALLYQASSSRSAKPVWVLDEAQVLDAEAAAQISAHHRYLLKDFDIDYRVVTQRGGEAINREAVARFRADEVGDGSGSGRGLLLLIDADRQQVRLEVSRQLEGVFVDAFVAYIENRQMKPFFQAGQLGSGILATTEMIVARALNAAANAGFASEGWAQAETGGAGATLNYGGPADSMLSGTNEAVEPATLPEETVRRYLQAMARRNLRPDLAIYSRATQAMLAGWVTTPAQADNLVNSYRRCTPEVVILESERAVVRYPRSQRACAPWFLVREGGAWRLDLTMLQQAVRFGRHNEWRFASLAHPYAFAFSDWRFDSRGFPVVE